MDPFSPIASSIHPPYHRPIRQPPITPRDRKPPRTRARLPLLGLGQLTITYTAPSPQDSRVRSLPRTPRPTALRQHARRTARMPTAAAPPFTSAQRMPPGSVPSREHGDESRDGAIARPCPTEYSDGPGCPVVRWSPGIRNEPRASHPTATPKSPSRHCVTEASPHRRPTAPACPLARRSFRYCERPDPEEYSAAAWRCPPSAPPPPRSQPSPRFQARRRENIPLFPVGIDHQRDVTRPVGIVFHRVNRTLATILVAFESICR